MEFTATPTTISLANFRQSLFGSWINFLQNDPAITSQTFQPDGLPLRVVPMYIADREETFVLPTVVIHRLKEEFVPGRTGNLHQIILETIAGIDQVTAISALRLSGMYQFDLLTRDLPSQFILTGYLDNKFQGTDKLDSDNTSIVGVKTSSVKSFMVKDLSKRITLADPVNDLPDTDVRVLWRPYEIKMVESFPRQKDLEQISYTVEFWCDLWYSEHDDRIVSIVVDTTRSDT